jgi:hypothetical protein
MPSAPVPRDRDLLSTSMNVPLPFNQDLDSPSRLLPMSVPAQIARHKRPAANSSSSSLPPAIKSWYTRFDKPTKPSRQSSTSEALSPVAKRTRSAKRSLSTENLAEGILPALFDDAVTSGTPVLDRLKNTWSSKYANKD